MAPDPHVARFDLHGCAVVLRRIEGPRASELFVACQPRIAADVAEQAEAAYRAVATALAAEGTGAEAIVAEKIFLRDVSTGASIVRAARSRALGPDGSAPPVTSIVGQPPLAAEARLELAVEAIVPKGAEEGETLERRGLSLTASGCAACAEPYGLVVRVGDETRLHAASLCASGEGAYEQTLGMFELAEQLLEQAGMAFGHVVRTWIHLREMDRDYSALNRARREFFATRGIDPPPASTGIGGGPASPDHDVCLGVYAVRSDPPPDRHVMTTPTLNEAPEYGADFVRGVRVVERNKVALHISGTASIDEAGRTAHPGDFDAQADRMLLNVSRLLAGQGAGFADVVSGIAYLKDLDQADRLRQKLQSAGLADAPLVLVEAPICRPDLLCETEVLAVLPRGDADGDASG